MKFLLNHLRIARKLALMSALFVIPMAAMLFFMVKNINDGFIDFARQELRGNEYQRPLEELLDTVQRHQLVSQRLAEGDASMAIQAAQLQAQVDRNFEALDAADALHGAALEFTSDGLGKLGRENAKPSAVRRKWSDLKARVSTLPAAESAKQGRRKANGHVLKAQDQCVKRVRIPILRMDH